MLKTLLKFIFAFALIYWLVASGKLDFSLIGQAFHVGYFWLIAIALVILQCLVGVFRYKTLLEIKSSKKIPYIELAKINWIGFFFSSMLPGAVTGDLVKLVYVKKLDQQLTKTFLVTTALLDRIIGLTGLLFLSGFFSLLYFNEITKISPQISHIILLNLFLFLGSAVFFLVLLSPIKFQNFLLKFLPKKIRSIFHQVFSLRENRKEIFFCFALSVTVQFFGVLAFWTVTSPFYNVHLPLPYAFSFIPIGMITVAIPISPGGLGVGHAIFANLFSLVHIANGASLFNLFFLCNLFVNLLGVIPYLLAGKKPSEKEMEEFK
jgi:uncharacterized membrane protein YbhN (UPF0104 family)